MCRAPSKKPHRRIPGGELAVSWEYHSDPDAGNCLRQAFKLILGEDALLLKPGGFDKKNKTRNDGPQKVGKTCSPGNKRTNT